jgi:aminoglycoside phosphotransferase (APT) family kinase protein
VLSYIEGLDAEEALITYQPNVQFNIGAEAGKDLRRMHQYAAPSDVTPWYERVIKKYRGYIEAYTTSGVTVKYADKIIRFIEDSTPYLKNRPNRFQHDDFHVANIIVNDGNYAGVIDFNRYDWGDPLHDFLKVGFFSSQVSVPFSVGQLTGYFQDELIPDQFWNLYSVYVAMSVFASVVWTMRVVPENIDGMMERINRVLEDHKYFESKKPSWFTG